MRAAGRAADPARAAKLRNYGPEQQGYKPGGVPRELWAEAYRAALADPNYLKFVAPGVAAKMRAAVNANPFLSRIIQFNGVAPLAPTGLWGIDVLHRHPTEASPGDLDDSKNCRNPAQGRRDEILGGPL